MTELAQITNGATSVINLVSLMLHLPFCVHRCFRDTKKNTAKQGLFDGIANEGITYATISRNNMPFVRLNDGTMLNINDVRSYQEEQRNVIDEIFQPTSSGISKKIGDNVQHETVLRITTNSEQLYTLHGSLADNAMSILKAG
jgi:hypothetical protein